MRGLQTLRHRYEPRDRKTERKARPRSPEQAAADAKFWADMRQSQRAETARIEAEWDAKHGIVRAESKTP